MTFVALTELMRMQRGHVDHQVYIQTAFVSPDVFLRFQDPTQDTLLQLVLMSP